MIKLPNKRKLKQTNHRTRCTNTCTINKDFDQITNLLHYLLKLILVNLIYRNYKPRGISN